MISGNRYQIVDLRWFTAKTTAINCRKPSDALAARHDSYICRYFTLNWIQNRQLYEVLTQLDAIALYAIRNTGCPLGHAVRKCGIIPLCIGQAKPTPVARLDRLPTAPASVNAKERFISYSNQGGVKRTKRTFLQEISWNPPPDSSLTPRFPPHHPKSGAHTNSLSTPQNEISSPAFWGNPNFSTGGWARPDMLANAPAP